MSENFLSFFSEDGKVIMSNAVREARALNHFYIGVEHFFLGSLRLEEGLTNAVLQKLGVDKGLVEKKIKEHVGMEPNLYTEKMMLTPRSSKIIELAMAEARRMELKLINEKILLLAMISEGESIPIRILRYMKVDLEQMKTTAVGLIATRREKIGDPSTPTVNKFGRDLTLLARQGKIEPVIGREKELISVAQILMKKKKNNPLIIGEAGVGKTAIVEGLAHKIASGEVPEQLRAKRIVELLMSTIVAGTMYRGQFEERLTGLLKEINAHKDLIIFIDEIHTIMGAGAAGGTMDAANIMKPALARGELSCIGATTISEDRQYIKKNSALSRRFTRVTVLEPTPDQTIEILKRIRGVYEKHHGVTITDEAIKAAVELSVRYVTGRNLPDKAIDLIDEAAAREKLGSLSQFSGRLPEEGARPLRVDREDIALIVSEWCGGIPVSKLVEEEKDRLIRMEEIIKQRIIGQDHCIKPVCKQIRKAKIGMTDPNRPLGVFLFLGPTGVGKTELAKALAEFLFGDENAIIRLDMSEYKERHTVSKIIGSPPGYVGFESGGRLTNMVRQKPFSLIVLDEIEKAHPDIHDLFLQVFDAGRLTDREEKPADFTNTIIIMTSNLGMDLKRQGKIGFRGKDEPEAQTSGWKDALERFFRPEFLGRIDEILVFNPLSADDLRKISRILLKKVKKRLASKNIELVVTDEAINFMIGTCDLNYGARPLRRAIENFISEPISEKLLTEEIREGDIVTVTEEQGKLKFTTKTKLGD
jgi:ATP-dependent Clp protease ATP-binding subunit ClpC